MSLKIEFQSTRPRGARLPGIGYRGQREGFQSTRPRGARLRVQQLPLLRLQFQSTRPRGARRRRSLAPVQSIAISIHAPAWGATPAKMISQACASYFNPRARVGRDLSRALVSRWSLHFNPRARVGRDIEQLSYRELVVISIHAPAWGATRRPYLCRHPALISIHAPAWGATW